MKDTKNSNRLLLNLTVIFYLMFSIAFAWFWYKTYTNYASIKTELINKFDSSLITNDSEIFEIQYNKTKGKFVTISPEEIDKINAHIKRLTEEVQKESNRAESIIDKDIDRLNLYMSIGIAFMTIIGIVVPVLVNVLSFDDIRTKQRELDENYKLLEERYEKVSGLENTVAIMETDMKKSFPIIKSLSLQYSISRYFVIAPYLTLDKNNFEIDKKHYIALLESIRSGFIECKNDKNLSIISGNETLKATINDFSYFIRSPKNHTSFFNRHLTSQFEQLGILLHNHVLSKSNEEETASFTKIENSLNIIIEIINQFYAQNKPTTQPAGNR